MDMYKEMANTVVHVEHKRILQDEDLQWKERALQAEKQIIHLLDPNFKQQSSDAMDVDKPQNNDSSQNKEDKVQDLQTRIASQKKLESFYKATQLLEKIKNSAQNEIFNVDIELKNLLFNNFLPMADSPVRNSCILITAEQMIEKIQPQEFHTQIIKEILEKNFEEKGVTKILNIYAQKIPILTSVLMAEQLLFVLQFNKEGNPNLGINSFIEILKCMDAVDLAIEQFNTENVGQFTDKILKLHKQFQELTEKVKKGFGMKFAMVETRIRKTIINFVTKFEALEQLQEDSIVQRVYQTMKRKIVPEFVLQNI